MPEEQEQIDETSKVSPDSSEAHHEAPKRVLVGVGAVLTLFIVGFILWLLVGR